MIDVRLHDDVEVGTFWVSGTRVVRLGSAARELLRGRVVDGSGAQGAALAGRLLDLDLADPVLDGVDGPPLTSVTVVVPVRDDPDGLVHLLDALDGSVRVVVVDDASHDPGATADAVDGRADLVRLSRNVGPAAARTAGLQEVTTPHVAFVDADVEVTGDELASLLRHLADPGLAAVAPRIRSTGGRGVLQAYEASSGSLDLGPRAATTRRWSPVSYVPSACLVARVADLGDGFDGSLRCGEDVDLVWRWQDAGRRVRHAAEVEVRHRSRARLRDWLARKAFYGTSAAPLAQRHGTRVAPAVLTPSAAVAVAGVLLQRRWSTAVAVVAASSAARVAVAAVPDLPAHQRRSVVSATAVAVARQASGLVLRHWSPALLALCLVSRRARRAVTVLGAVDAAVAYRAQRPAVDVVRFTALRRAEHLAYGAGVWWGAARAGSARCLVPRWVRSGRAGRGS